jgi:hypothetical protein
MSWGKNVVDQKCRWGKNVVWKKYTMFFIYIFLLQLKAYKRLKKPFAVHLYGLRVKIYIFILECRVARFWYNCTRLTFAYFTDYRCSDCHRLCTPAVCRT